MARTAPPGPESESMRRGAGLRTRRAAVLLLMGLAVAVPARGGPEAQALPARIDPVILPDPSSPGRIPEPLFPQIQRAEQIEHSGVFSPDGGKLYVTVSDPEFRSFTVLVLERRGEGWAPPRTASFSGAHSDHGTSFSADGRTLYFASLRPLPGGARRDAGSWRLWTARRQAGAWSEARIVEVPGWRRHWQSHPVAAADGTLYFHRQVSDDTSDFDLYRTSLRDGRHGIPERLGTTINTGGIEISPYLAPDGSYLLFTAYGRPDGRGGGDLYISRSDGNGGWLTPDNLGPEINTPAEESNSTLTADGEILVFSSSREAPGTAGGAGLHLYWVSMKKLAKRLQRDASQHKPSAP